LIDIGSKSLEFYAALGRSHGHLLDLADFFAASSIAVSAVMSPPLVDAGPRLFIPLYHTRPLTFSDFAIPNKALDGAPKHLLNRNNHRTFSTTGIPQITQKPRRRSLRGIIVRPFELEHISFAEMTRRLTRTDSSIDFPLLCRENGAFFGVERLAGGAKLRAEAEGHRGAHDAGTTPGRICEPACGCLSGD
jgi:hypothetical protein